jgi:hypothetical protein
MNNSNTKDCYKVILNSDKIKKLEDDTFRIKIDLPLRSMGVIDMEINREVFTINSAYFTISILHRDDVNKIYSEAYDQLLDPLHNLPSYVIKKILRHIEECFMEIESIITYFNWNNLQNERIHQ